MVETLNYTCYDIIGWIVLTEVMGLQAFNKIHSRKVVDLSMLAAWYLLTNPKLDLAWLVGD